MLPVEILGGFLKAFLDSCVDLCFQMDIGGVQITVFKVFNSIFECFDVFVLDCSSVRSCLAVPGKRFFRVGRSLWRSLRGSGRSLWRWLLGSFRAFVLSDVSESDGSIASNELALLVGVILFS